LSPPRYCIALLCTAVVGAAAVAAGDPGVSGYQEGNGASPIQGAAGTGGSTGDSGLEHCDKPMGAVTVVEPQNNVMQALHHYELQSPVGLIRMMIQPSNCSIVVERGAAMQNMQPARQLSAAGQLRSNSNMGSGQLVTADFIITPSVALSEHNAGGVISGVNPLAAPADGAQTGATINRSDELVVIGAEQNGNAYAQGGPASGWAKKALMMLR
jgi:hypothetical protein